jgi:hypothetical protein
MEIRKSKLEIGKLKWKRREAGAGKLPKNDGEEGG